MAPPPCRRVCVWSCRVVGTVRDLSSAETTVPSCSADAQCRTDGSCRPHPDRVRSRSTTRSHHGDTAPARAIRAASRVMSTFAGSSLDSTRLLLLLLRPGLADLEHAVHFIDTCSCRDRFAGNISISSWTAESQRLRETLRWHEPIDNHS